VVSLMGRVVQGCSDVFALQRRVIPQDFFDGSSRAKQFENIGNTGIRSQLNPLPRPKISFTQPIGGSAACQYLHYLLTALPRTTEVL